MNLESLSDSHLVPWIAMLAVAVAALSATILLGSAVLDGAFPGPGAADGPLMSPFRWVPLARDLA